MRKSFRMRLARGKMRTLSFFVCSCCYTENLQYYCNPVGWAHSESWDRIGIVYSRLCHNITRTLSPPFVGRCTLSGAEFSEHSFKGHQLEEIYRGLLFETVEITLKKEVWVMTESTVCGPWAAANVLAPMFLLF